MADMFEEYRRQQADKEKPAGTQSTPPTIEQKSAPPAPAATAQTGNVVSGGRCKSPSGLDYEILYPGSNSMLKVYLKAGQGLKAEAGAMAAMSSTIDVEGKMEGGLLGGLGRMLAGEKFFFQTLKANRGAGEVMLSPAALGTLGVLELNGDGYIVQKDGFFAGSDGITVNTTMQNLAQGFFSGEGFFILKIHGTGTLFISSYGAIHPLEIPAGEELVVDNEHLVAWPEHSDYHIDKASAGWFSSFTSGEGLVCRFRGPAKIYIQTRNPSGFGQWVRRFIPTNTA